MLVCPGQSSASRPEELQSEIKARQEQLTRHQMTVDKLSQQEREVYSRLARAEERLNAISRDLESQENRLEELVSREAELASEYEILSREKDATREELAALMDNMWPIFLQSQGKGMAKLMEWPDLDREMTWLRAIYREAENTYSLLQDQSAELASSLVRLDIMKDEYQSGLSQVNTTKNRLLNEKLSFLGELREIRAKRLADQEIVDEILDIIDALNYQLTVSTHREFESLKGFLLWPATGKLTDSYSPSGNPPHNGLSISLEENQPVRAISWGQVMHNDTLRGFGRVVILYHGNNYYTLYAYLSESSTQIGQEVEKGETIGLAGYYPKINSHGIYFELRFKQKAINPIPWLEKS